jgi:hypothetical protein
VQRDRTKHSEELPVEKSIDRVKSSFQLNSKIKLLIEQMYAIVNVGIDNDSNNHQLSPM